MATWAGFDSTSFAYDFPRPAPWSCNPNSQGLAVYTANHYLNRTPTAKYFCRYFQTGGGFSSFDPAEVSSLRAAQLFYLLPIAAPSYTRETRNDQLGKDWGRQDATDCLNKILTVLNGGYGVTLDALAGTYVYLDIESGTPISAWYWEGWSETIYLYSDSTWDAPFWPCVYATPSTVPNSTDKATMDMLVGYNNRGDAQHSCYGLWTTQPSYSGSSTTVCNYSANNPGPTWDLAAGHPQGYTGLVLHYWQYALDGNFWIPACQTTPPGSTCCDSCRPHVDNNQSQPNEEMMNHVLRIT